MDQTPTADLEAIIGEGPLGGYQVLVAALCAVVAMIDGFDTQSIALAAPQIAALWKIPPAAFGLVFGAGLLGALFGALGFGVAADRFGRKPALMTAVLMFGLISLLTPFTRNLPELIAVRLAAGLGLGGALPGVISLTSEYAPHRLRATVVSLMFCGFPLGAVAGGLAAAALMPHYGWRSVFFLGSADDLVMLPVIALIFPESMRFLALRRNEAAVRRTLGRLGLEAAWTGEFPAARQAPPKASLLQIFEQGRALGTVLLSATFLLSLLLAYFLVNWLPLMARRSGIGLSAAVLGVAALNLGAVGGCLIIGRLADRYGPAAPIGLGYILGAAAIAAIGHAGGSAGLFLATAFLAGLSSIGAQMCVVALCANFYETSVRATGMGWIIGMGRIGAILGPILGGLLIGAGVSMPRLFLVAGGVSLAAAAGALAVGAFVLPRRGAAGARARRNDPETRPA